MHRALRALARFAALVLVVAGLSTPTRDAGATWIEPAAPPAAYPLAVMSFNVCGGVCRRGEVARTAAFTTSTALRHQASVVLLQELCLRQYRRIRSVLAGHGYIGRFAATTRSRACGGAFGVALLVRGSTSGTLVNRLPVRRGLEPRVLLGTHLDVGGRRTLVAVVHLSPSAHAGLPNQLRAVAGYLDRPAIIGGDFNAVPTHPGMRPFYARCVELDGRRRAPTYDAGAKKIDYVFGSAGLVAAAGAESVSTTMS
ncbi:MAG TPA: endonuclease/exonuclease/phosphatase family protein, partial [Actinoplanes sp.]|nr:endonuclease/exonuclease/phosphatase family protein [Actinoplanes sp.]